MRNKHCVDLANFPQNICQVENINLFLQLKEYKPKHNGLYL